MEAAHADGHWLPATGLQREGLHGGLRDIPGLLFHCVEPHLLPLLPARLPQPIHAFLHCESRLSCTMRTCRRAAVLWPHNLVHDYDAACLRDVPSRARCRIPKSSPSRLPSVPTSGLPCAFKISKNILQVVSLMRPCPCLITICLHYLLPRHPRPLQAQMQHSVPRPISLLPA